MRRCVVSRPEKERTRSPAHYSVVAKSVHGVEGSDCYTSQCDVVLGRAKSERKGTMYGPLV